MSLFFITALFLALLFEGTITTLPLVLIVLLSLTILRRDAIVFAVAFFSGILLDILLVQTIGLSSLFFMIMLYLILLYQKKYEINSYPFVAAAAFLGSAGFLLLVGKGNVLLDPLINVFAALMFFALVRFFYLKDK